MLDRQAGSRLDSAESWAGPQGDIHRRRRDVDVLALDRRRTDLVKASLISRASRSRTAKTGGELDVVVGDTSEDPRFDVGTPHREVANEVFGGFGRSRSVRDPLDLLPEDLAGSFPTLAAMRHHDGQLVPEELEARAVI